MIVGVPKEIKPQENRVGLVPAGARALVGRGHRVLVEKGAGLGSGIPDAEYIAAGATMVDSADEVWGDAGLIWKVKEPIAPEYGKIRADQILYTYLHLAPDRPQTDALLASNCVAIAYETIEVDGKLPLLTPMSEVAGRLSIQAGARSLEKHAGGRGVLLGGVPGVAPGKVTVIGGGIVGQNAMAMAVGLGADVTVLDINLDVLRDIDGRYRGSVKTVFSNAGNLAASIAEADLVIGAVLIPGAKAPHLIKRAHLSDMKPGAVLVDVAVDQGGCAETTRPTTHAEPTYLVDGVVHYCVANMPGAVARTSTFALNNATLRYGMMLADLGWERALDAAPELVPGVNVAHGAVTYGAVAEAHGLPLQNLR
ncbi:MAG: alanine dehydrogenase [Deltaproteobacteria bacterium]|nr:alanine dehydrogenase [Deltaproteobacteria bacterium]HCH63257.1 alanine dehydrogenase [Deltaproteobacteria bacterium]